MQVIAICLGLLSCIYLSECAITGWTTPTGGSTADYDAGMMYLNEGATTIITPVATTDASLGAYALASQSTTDFFEIVTASTGVVTLKGTNVLDGDAATLTHTVKISQTDSGSSVGTVTITFSIINGQFATGYTCIYLGPTLAASGTVMTNAMSSEGTNAIVISSGNTNTDFQVGATTGVITTANALTPASGTSGSYTLILTGAESIGTAASTVTSTINICMRGSSCVCSVSSATNITACLLVMFAAAIMMLLK